MDLTIHLLAVRFLFRQNNKQIHLQHPFKFQIQLQKENLIHGYTNERLLHLNVQVLSHQNRGLIPMLFFHIQEGTQQMLVDQNKGRKVQLQH